MAESGLEKRRFLWILYKFCIPIKIKWFIRGVDAALLAPTAMNQQKFVFSLDGNTVTAKAGVAVKDAYEAKNIIKMMISCQNKRI